MYLKYTQSPPFLTEAGGCGPSELAGHFSQNLQQKLVHVPTSQAYSDFSLHIKTESVGKPHLIHACVVVGSLGYLMP